MRSRTDLHLHEQILLLALRDRKGTPESGSGYARLAMGGAIVAELALGGRISVEEGKRARVEAVGGADEPGDEILAEALALVRDRDRPQSAAEWVQAFSRLKRLRERAALGLCRRGILRSTEAKVLLVFNRKAYPTVDPGPENELVARLREAVAGDGDVDPAVGVLVSMAYATDLLEINLGRKLVRARTRRVKDIVAGGRLAAGGHAAGVSREAVRSAVKAVQAAVIDAVVATLDEEVERTLEDLRRLRGRRLLRG
ncbi:MAG: GPP34 family phosphoprotein [Gemmatimonadetes bacterium]|nr:GPP34 family phosphoprotein [Gemmatimonadota bacterium]